MKMHNLDSLTATKFLSQILERATCLECCRYYLVPETATCGHTLCHGCWYRRKSCANCMKPLNRNSLKVNIQLQNFTDHVHLLVDEFEKLFNIKLDELAFDNPDVNNKDSKSEQTKNVKHWLTNSQNHFSVPITNSQQSTQAFQSIKLSPNKIQMHEKTKKTIDSAKLVQIPQAQDDWDKIEILPDTEDLSTNHKDNVTGPMDIEPDDYVDDNEYTSQNPRRSSRKKDTRNQYQCSELFGVSKQSSNHSTNEIDIKNKNAKQNWNNVKKMRKEFSKLNKKKRSKLNVSIEMCKKTQSTLNKPHATSPPIVSDQIPYVIDDHSQNVFNTDEVVVGEKIVSKDNGISIDPHNEHLESDRHNHNIVYNDPNINNDNNNSEQYSNNDKVITKNQLKLNHTYNTTHQNVTMNKIPFLKKSSLHMSATKKSPLLTGGINLDKYLKPADTNMDDIEINIKVGNTLTNIYIRKKDNNDVQINVNTDRGIQTSLSPYIITNQNESLSTKGVKLPPEYLTMKHVGIQVPKNSDKSILDKKETASADTLVVPFEMAENVEKELSNVIEDDNLKNTKNNSNNTQHSHNTIGNYKCVKGVANIAQATNAMKATEEDIDMINYLDVFESDSPKEARVKSLKNTGSTQSEILIPTIKSAKVRNTQKHSDKRNRDVDNEEETPNKKAKINQDIKINQFGKEQIDNNHDDLNSENYDAIMGQVFANIDTDIENMQEIRNRLDNQKDSENVFSLYEKDNIRNSISKEIDQIPGPEIQKNIDNLLTPDVYRESIPKNMQTDSIEMKTLCTPAEQNVDDSDKSIVEETPQKIVSFSNHKTKNDHINKQDNDSIKHDLQKSEKRLQDNINLQDISGVVDLSDTISNTNEKQMNVIKSHKKNTLETPPTINKFVDLIKHKSTPVARKSLNFANDITECNKDPDQTLCSVSLVAKTTQENEFMSKAFEKTPESQIKMPLPVKNMKAVQNKKLYVAGSCLTSDELNNVKHLCLKRNWIWVDKYTKDLSHLIVGVDDENKSQRTAKYMSALAAGKWIVSYAWVQKCLQTNEIVDEEPYEVLDNTGEPGPRRSRVAIQKLFHGITFYCMPPFTVLDVDTIKDMLEAAGGRVVGEIDGVRAGPSAPALLLAEPEHTQENRFMCLAMERGVVPVNYEWMLNSLGGYTLNSIDGLLLCPASLLPLATASWPAPLIAPDDQ